MIILRAYKTRLDPTKEQLQDFFRYAGAARFVYNWALADRIGKYKAGEKSNRFEQEKRFNSIKSAQFPWISEIPYSIQGVEFRNLDVAYANFFRRIKEGAKEKGFPKFKSRFNDKHSFTFRGSFHIESDRIKLPIIGWIKLFEKNYLPVDGVKILQVTVSKQADFWFASVQVEMEVDDPVNGGQGCLGVDVGIKRLAVCSDGTVFENPKALVMNEKKLARLQRELSRRKKGSANREKTKQKISRLHYKIACIRNFALHNASSYITKIANPKTVVMENLNVSGMLKNKKLSKAISDVGFYELTRQVEYKSNWQGVEFIKADRWFPSSKTCSNCGSVKPLLTLSERVYVCEECGIIIDRDLNAAINLAALVKAETLPDCLRS